MSSQTLSADADDRDVVQSSRASKRRRIGSHRPAQSIEVADGQESSDEEAAKVSRRRRTQASSAVADREGSEESSGESDPDDYSTESDSDGLNILGKAEVPLFGGYDAVDEGVLDIRAQHPDPGSIRAISMLDFMCHQNVTAYLGPNVNVITGKNGSGKSAICAALMLAFDCRPADTGRGASLAKMIRSGCSYCEVSVTFFNKEHEKRHFIGREREPAARIAPSSLPPTHTPSMVRSRNHPMRSLAGPPALPYRNSTYGDFIRVTRRIRRQGAGAGAGATHRFKLEGGTLRSAAAGAKAEGGSRLASPGISGTKLEQIHFTTIC